MDKITLAPKQSAHYCSSITIPQGKSGQQLHVAVEGASKDLEQSATTDTCTDCDTSFLRTIVAQSW